MSVWRKYLNGELPDRDGITRNEKRAFKRRAKEQIRDQKRTRTNGGRRHAR